jgi:hypothetical protein
MPLAEPCEHHIATESIVTRLSPLTISPTNYTDASVVISTGRPDRTSSTILERPGEFLFFYTSYVRLYGTNICQNKQEAFLYECPLQAVHLPTKTAHLHVVL